MKFHISVALVAIVIMTLSADAVVRRKCAKICPLIYAPVCGSNLVTYSNLCNLRSSACIKKIRISVLFRGPCKCLLQPVTGPCEALFRRFYYNVNLRKCLPFIYGGCGGNRNNFKSKTSCASDCKF
ncbi:turripeptide Ici9.2-like isoform X2 [Xenia sp. Carnegie-2017]|uniref:turripeptide Ici9.2-like isoform X2 n=1 Tax=Xenia sp. Carnegie-2017 TaxID=2897299 RepID=UPI001F03B780|nr:turripeptide Ici9.2-like isoform X2 [Xenia sp. Carnegie-2017]